MDRAPRLTGLRGRPVWPALFLVIAAVAFLPGHSWAQG